MHRVCGRAQAPTAGLQHAPLALGDDDERVTRGLRIEGLAAAAASTFSRGSLSLLDRLPPPPSSARTARPYLPTTHGVEHGEWRGEHSAVVGLAGTVGGEQQGRTQDASGFIEAVMVLPVRIESWVRKTELSIVIPGLNCARS